MNPVALRLPDEVSQRLKRLADLTGRSKTFYMAAQTKGGGGLGNSLRGRPARPLWSCLGGVREWAGTATWGRKEKSEDRHVRRAL